MSSASVLGGSAAGKSMAVRSQAPSRPDARLGSQRRLPLLSTPQGVVAVIRAASLFYLTRTRLSSRAGESQPGGGRRAGPSQHAWATVRGTGPRRCGGRALQRVGPRQGDGQKLPSGTRRAGRSGISTGRASGGSGHSPASGPHRSGSRGEAAMPESAPHAAADRRLVPGRTAVRARGFLTPYLLPTAAPAAGDTPESKSHLCLRHSLQEKKEASRYSASFLPLTSPVPTPHHSPEDGGPSVCRGGRSTTGSPWPADTHRSTSCGQVAQEPHRSRTWPAAAWGQLS